MEINTITTADMARTRFDWTFVPAGGFRAVLTGTPMCADFSASFMGGVGHVGGESIIDASVIKPSDNADNRSGTDWSPPV